jgi:hypothetical protein
VDSPEFTEWAALYALEHEEQTGEKSQPSSYELGDKLRAWATMHNATVKR